jgi:hypothetical protein
MANLTAAFDTLLKGHEAAPTQSFSPDTADEFLKEAYRIVRPSAIPALLDADELTFCAPEHPHCPAAH